jgi:3-oxoacyl-[acyl-carrier protein] reductase
VVTGGSAGLGRAIAKTLVQHEARVMIVGRRQDALDHTVRELKSVSASDVIAVSADVTKADDVARLGSAVQSAWASSTCSVIV